MTEFREKDICHVPVTLVEQYADPGLWIANYNFSSCDAPHDIIRFVVHTDDLTIIHRAPVDLATCEIPKGGVEVLAPTAAGPMKCRMLSRFEDDSRLLAVIDWSASEKYRTVPVSTLRPVDVTPHTPDDAEIKYNANLRQLVESSMDVWSKALGWGLTGSQPECWALMDATVRRHVEIQARERKLGDALDLAAKRLSRLAYDLVGAHKATANDWADEARKALAHAAAASETAGQRARVVQLESALKPFVDFFVEVAKGQSADWWSSTPENAPVVGRNTATLTFGHFTDAHKAIFATAPWGDV